MTTSQKLITALVTLLIVLAVASTPYWIYLLGRIVCGPEVYWLECFAIGCFVIIVICIVLLIFILCIIPLYFKVARWLFNYDWTDYR